MRITCSPSLSSRVHKPAGCFVLHTKLGIIICFILQLRFLKPKQKTRKAGAGIGTWAPWAFLVGGTSEKPIIPLLWASWPHLGLLTKLHNLEFSGLFAVPCQALGQAQQVDIGMPYTLHGHGKAKGARGGQGKQGPGHSPVSHRV